MAIWIQKCVAPQGIITIKLGLWKNFLSQLCLHYIVFFLYLVSLVKLYYCACITLASYGNKETHSLGKGVSLSQNVTNLEARDKKPTCIFSKEVRLYLATIVRLMHVLSNKIHFWQKRWQAAQMEAFKISSKQLSTNSFSRSERGYGYGLIMIVSWR